MKVRCAVLTAVNTPLQIMELEQVNNNVHVSKFLFAWSGSRLAQ